MLTVGDLTPVEFAARLATGGIGVRLGPFDTRVRATVRGLAVPMQHLYRHYPLLDDQPRVHSFHVHMRELPNLRLGRARLVRFTVDGYATHEDMPTDHALAVLEWGINFVVAMRFSSFLMLHSAVLERGGRALVMPASPGHGKTTLCVALAHRGWRLFSDEFGLMRPQSDQFVPMPRPMPLKNESIAVLREFAPEAVLGPEIPRTRKGTVAHVRAPLASVKRSGEHAPAGWVVFPRWRAGARFSLQELPRSDGFLRLATNAFNYEKLGAIGFDTLKRLVDGCRCFRLEYSDLEQAVSALTLLADQDAR